MVGELCALIKRALVTLLDGTRDRAQLATEMNCSPLELDQKLLSLQRHAVLLG